MVGEHALLAECVRLWRERGHRVTALVSPEAALRDWAGERGITSLPRLDSLEAALDGEPFDYLFSITNMRIVPQRLLDLPRRMAVNFHDALLPRHAGVQATSWALLESPAEHGVTWHVMTAGADEGDVLLRRCFDVGPDDTAYDLNTACFQAGTDSFAELADLLAAGRAAPEPQDMRLRTYHGRGDVLPGGGLLRWTRGGRGLHALVRAAALGRSENAFGTAKLPLPGGGYLVVGRSRLSPAAPGARPPGTLLAADTTGLTVSTADQALTVGDLRDPDGTPVPVAALLARHALRPGDLLPVPDPATVAALVSRMAATRPGESRWARRLARVRPYELPYAGGARGPAHPSPGPGDAEGYDLSVPATLAAAAGGAPPEVAALAAVLLFLARTADAPQLDVGFRPSGAPDPFFAATLPLRVPAAEPGRTFADYCAEVAAATAADDTHLSDLPARRPALAGAPGRGGLPVVVGIGGTADVPPGACAQVVVAPGGDRCRLLLAADRVEPGAADALRTDMAAFLGALCAAPGDVAGVPLLSGARRTQVLEDWNATATSTAPEACVPALVSGQALRRPAATAVAAADGTLTYAQLDSRADRLAAAMAAAGVRRGSLVGVYLDRSADLVAALLGVMKAGAAYVPLDPVYPPDRIRAMAEDAGVSLLLTGRGLPLPDAVRGLGVRELDVTQAAAAPQPPAAAVTPDPGDLAYVIYTSGSTGRPKGVRIAHRALANFLRAMAAEPGCTDADRLLAVTTVCFDIAGLELFLPLVTGGCVELVPEQVASDGYALRARLERSRPTVMQATPATWRLLIATGWEGDPALRALCGGEALPADLAAGLLSRVGELWNLYGPTETTVWSAAVRIRPGDRVTLGRPIANTRCYVLDPGGRPLPPYVAGELYIGGAGVADGYHGRPELTAEKFVPDAFARSGRLYRTGDLVRWLADGRLDYLGRIDDQVKIDGFRIELGEIEAVLQRHAGVRRAVVAAREDTAGTRRLVGYLIPEGPVAPTSAELRRHLARDLPGYMVPALYVPLAEIPLTRNGKVDRKALPAPPRTTAPVPATARPRPGTEEAVASVWRAVLARDDIGVDDNFFDAGGNSLLLVEAVKRLNAALALRLTSVDMFRHPTVRTMAASLTAPAPAPAARTGTPARIDRTLLHRRRHRA